MEITVKCHKVNVKFIILCSPFFYYADDKLIWVTKWKQKARK